MKKQMHQQISSAIYTHMCTLLEYRFTVLDNKSSCKTYQYLELDVCELDKIWEIIVIESYLFKEKLMMELLLI